MIYKWLLSILLIPFLLLTVFGQNERDEMIGAIYFPYKSAYVLPESWHRVKSAPEEGTSRAHLSIDIRHLNNESFTLCFAFMVDSMSDVASLADVDTFWKVLRSFSIKAWFPITFENDLIVPFKWIRSCFTIDMEASNVSLVVK